MSNRRLAIGASVLVLALGGCGDGEHEDLKQWMQESTKDLKGRVAPLPEMKPYEAVAYDAAGNIDPFKAAKLNPANKAGGGGLLPDFNRPKEALEAYPLESLKYVGFLYRGKLANGIVLADSSLHQVKIGNYMGQNFGIITNIDETQIVLFRKVLVIGWSVSARYNSRKRGTENEVL